MNKLAKLLLATTCLTAVSAASAAAVSEVEPNNSLGAAQVLPLGTTQITGTLVSDFINNFSDFFRLEGLLPGGSFTVTLDANPGIPVGESGMFALSSTGTILDSEFLIQDGDTLTGTVPSNGILVLQIEGATTNTEIVYPYTLDISAPRVAAVPEPSVLSLLAAGAAGLGAVRGLWRKRPKR